MEKCGHGHGHGLSGATALPILELMNRAELRIHLNQLDAAVPILRASSPDRRHFWQAFANMTAAIESKAATSEDAQFVGCRAEEVLSWHGLENTDDHV